jgi:hypothetical protein
MLFGSLLPASYLVMGRDSQSGAPGYRCMTIDSSSAEAILLCDIFDIDMDFVAGVFEPQRVLGERRDEIFKFFEEALHAWEGHEFSAFLDKYGTLPATVELASRARSTFLKARRLRTLNPFALENPGDDLRTISREIEWNIFRTAQHKERSAQLINLVLGDRKAAFSASDIIKRLVFDFPKIDALLLSGSQQRKARAGRSYEHHIAAMLNGGCIRFQKQVVIDKARRADFVLPSRRGLEARDSTAPGLILSAKTTLRERWKQVLGEMGPHRLFLTTLDENIPGTTIDDMASFGATLVVPESLIHSSVSEYGSRKNVVTFKAFCEEFARQYVSGAQTGS